MSIKTVAVLTLVTCFTAACSASPSTTMNWLRLANRTQELQTVVEGGYVKSMAFLAPYPTSMDIRTLMNSAKANSAPHFRNVQRKIEDHTLTLTQVKDSFSKIFEVRTRTVVRFETEVAPYVSASIKLRMCRIYYEQGTAMCAIEREIYGLLIRNLMNMDADEIEGRELLNPDKREVNNPRIGSLQRDPECGWNSWCIVCGRC